MNRKEFNAWYASFGRALPDTARWVASLPDPEATLALWAEVLTEVDPRDASAVTKRLLLGDDDKLPAYDRESYPAYIRRLCWANASRRKARTRRSRQPEAPLGPSRVQGPSAGEILLAVMEARDSGKSEADAREIVERMIPEQRDDRRDWVSCELCRGGLVECWHPKTVGIVKYHGEIPETGLYVCVIACSCRQGETASGALASGRRFDPALWCRCRGGNMNGETNRRDLLDFAPQWNTARQAENYVEEFEQHNEREWAP